MTELTEEQKDEFRDHHRQFLAHLDIKRERDDKLSYDDAMWLMMRAAENAIGLATDTGCDDDKLDGDADDWRKALDKF